MRDYYINWDQGQLQLHNLRPKILITLFPWLSVRPDETGVEDDAAIDDEEDADLHDREHATGIGRL